jgi:hypothetical protein
MLCRFSAVVRSRMGGMCLPGLCMPNGDYLASLLLSENGEAFTLVFSRHPGIDGGKLDVTREVYHLRGRWPHQRFLS